MATCAASTHRAGICRCPRLADGAQEIRRLVRREHTYGSDWIKTANAGGYFSVGDDPARPPGSTMRWTPSAPPHAYSGCPFAVHTGAAEACKQAIRCGVRSLEHAYLIDEEAIDMAKGAGAYVVPTMQMTQEDLGELQEGRFRTRRCGSSAATTNNPRFAATRRVQRRESGLRNRLRHVPLQPRHPRVPGDGRRGTQPHPGAARRDFGGR